MVRLRTALVLVLAGGCGGPPVPEPLAPGWQREVDRLRARHFVDDDLDTAGRRRLAQLLDFEAGLADQAAQVQATLNDDRARRARAWRHFERGEGARPQPRFDGVLPPDDPAALREAWLAAGPDAVALARRWTQRWPRDASGWFALGEAWPKSAEVTAVVALARARAALGRALAIDPHHIAARRALAALPAPKPPGPTPDEVAARPCPPESPDVAAAMDAVARFDPPADVADDFARSRVVVVHESLDDRVVAGGVRWRTRHRLFRVPAGARYLQVPMGEAVERLRVHHPGGRVSPASAQRNWLKFDPIVEPSDLVELRTVERAPAGPFTARMVGHDPAIRAVYTVWLPKGTASPRAGAPTAEPVAARCGAAGWRFALDAVGVDHDEPFALAWRERVPHVSVGEDAPVADPEPKAWRWTVKLDFTAPDALRGTATLVAEGPGTEALRDALHPVRDVPGALEALIVGAIPGVYVGHVEVRQDGTKLRVEATISARVVPGLFGRSVLASLSARPDPQLYAPRRRSDLRTRPLEEHLQLTIDTPVGWHIATEWDSFEVVDPVVQVRQVVQRQARSLALERVTRVAGTVVPAATHDAWGSHLGAVAAALDGRLKFERGERREDR